MGLGKLSGKNKLSTKTGTQLRKMIGSPFKDKLEGSSSIGESTTSRKISTTKIGPYFIPLTFKFGKNSMLR